MHGGTAVGRGGKNAADRGAGHARGARAHPPLHRFLKEGELPYEDEKFSFLAVTREAVHPAGARVRRRPQVHSGYVELPLCRGDRIETVKVTRKSGNFKAARKAEVGQRWEEEQE